MTASVGLDVLRRHGSVGQCHQRLSVSGLAIEDRLRRLPALLLGLRETGKSAPA